MPISLVSTPYPKLHPQELIGRPQNAKPRFGGFTPPKSLLPRSLQMLKILYEGGDFNGGQRTLYHEDSWRQGDLSFHTEGPMSREEALKLWDDLTSRGLIESSDTPRVYARLTPKGRQYIEQKLREWKDSGYAMRMEDDYQPPQPSKTGPRKWLHQIRRFFTHPDARYLLDEEQQDTQKKKP